MMGEVPIPEMLSVYYPQKNQLTSQQQVILISFRNSLTNRAGVFYHLQHFRVAFNRKSITASVFMTLGMLYALNSVWPG